jgi:hypothetical protein
MIEKNLFKCVKNRRRIGENSTFYLWPINRDDTLLFFLDKMKIDLLIVLYRRWIP